MYLTYDEYKNTYGGTLPETEFVLAEFKARKQIDYWTDSRVQNMASIPEEVKLCIMQLVKVDSKFGVDAQAANPVIASFNTDGYSESYGSVSEQQEAAEKNAYKVTRNLLYGVKDDEGTPLLYRGVYL